jgi:hypothetical protein
VVSSVEIIKIKALFLIIKLTPAHYKIINLGRHLISLNLYLINFVAFFIAASKLDESAIPLPAIL